MVVSRGNKKGESAGRSFKGFVARLDQVNAIDKKSEHVSFGRIHSTSQSAKFLKLQTKRS